MKCTTPSSVPNWKRLTDHRKETVFHTLAQAVGARINNKEPARWLLIGDLNTKETLLNKWSSCYWHESIKAYTDSLALRITVTPARPIENKHGDYIVSQGVGVHRSFVEIGVCHRTRKAGKSSDCSGGGDCGRSHPGRSPESSREMRSGQSR